MTLWKLEVLRLTRTKRWIALLGTFVAFGLVGPVTARYIQEILSGVGGDLEGATITLPDPVAQDGLAQYISNAAQVGVLVAVVIAAGALAFDAVPEMGVFLRTRVTNTWRILIPRLVVSFVAIAVAFTAGTLAAWYETWALIGPLPAGPVLLATAYSIVFLAFMVAVVAAVAQWVRTVLATVMWSLVILIVMPLFGISGAIAQWLPSTLLGALGHLDGVEAGGEYPQIVVVTVAQTVALVWLAKRGADRREA